MAKWLIVLIAAISGCGALEVRDIDVSKELIAKPVHQVYIFPPAFSQKYEVRMKDWAQRGDYQDMKPEHQAASADVLLSAFSSVLNSSTSYASLKLATDYVPDEEARCWAENLAKLLVNARYSPNSINLSGKKDFDPKSIIPIDLPVESVLIVGVVSYGQEDTQWVWHTILDDLSHVKPRRIGKSSWQAACHLTAILVNPKTGQLLMDSDWELTSLDSEHQDPAALEAITKEAVEAILDGATLKKRALVRLGF